ncbi:polygalacturonase ADPG2 [Mercurialis annua]|uniref:polygalacturonase ADPG2 n=1 Tax=Mercurialis annua TaxID=3986 RepID=UPI00215E4FBB|nr:polygalacturonase ADPG2 [Mercurialis annua]
MKRNKNASFLFFIFVLMAAFIMFAIISVEARKHHHSKKTKSHKHLKEKSGGGRDSPGSDSAAAPGPAPSSPPLPPYGGSYPTQSNIFDILSFGAEGDGVSDDSQALLAAWKAACKVSGATIRIPAEKFLIKPITLQGPCMPHLLLQIDGTVLAPQEVGSWPKSSLFQWFNFKWVHDFSIQGTGSVNGQGFNWWTPSNLYFIQKRFKHIPDMKPTALRFYASYNVTVRDIEITNSPQCHLKFDNSKGIKVDNITISSPENSPNTDGIHLQNTQDVEIHHSNIGTGDDCISIQTGCSNIHIHHINCGPGHGISLGGLGKDKSVACVSNIVVEKISLQNTLAGVRIKTWQGGLGSVKNISFSNIQVSDVKYPIIIDQFYCDKHICKNQTEGVLISGVKYDQIIGSYTTQPIHLACSKDVPCIDVDLTNIQLKASSRLGSNNNVQQALCWNSYGKSQAPIYPSTIDYCLMRDSGFIRRIARSHEHLC